MRNRRQHDLLVAQSNNELVVSDRRIIKDVLIQSIPGFIIIGAAFNGYNLFDLISFQPIMRMTTNLSVHAVNNLYALFAGNANKLMMIVISLAVAMGDTSIPVLSEMFTKKDYEGVRRQITDAIELFLIVMVPAALGMAAVSRPLYTLFYGYDLQDSSYCVLLLIWPSLLDYFTC